MKQERLIGRGWDKETAHAQLCILRKRNRGEREGGMEGGREGTRAESETATLRGTGSQCDAIGCELLSFNWSLSICLTEPGVCGRITAGLHPSWEICCCSDLKQKLTCYSAQAEGGWLERRSRLGQGRAGCQAVRAGPHRKQPWLSLCSRSGQCSAPWPWWPTGCLRLCPHLWDSMGPPSPEGAPQKGL